MDMHNMFNGLVELLWKYCGAGNIYIKRTSHKPETFEMEILNIMHFLFQIECCFYCENN